MSTAATLHPSAPLSSGAAFANRPAHTAHTAHTAHIAHNAGDSVAENKSPSPIETSYHLGKTHKTSSNQHVVYVPKDTKAWGAQVWISFAIATFLCAVGLAYLPGQDLDRAFMVMGYFFCLSAAFMLSKFVRDNQHTRRDTPLYAAVVYTAFGAAVALTAWGLFRMTIAESYKAYLLVSWLYLITTTFTLAKTLRDRHEVAVAVARIAGRNDAALHASAAHAAE